MSHVTSLAGKHVALTIKGDDVALLEAPEGDAAGAAPEDAQQGTSSSKANATSTQVGACVRSAAAVGPAQQTCPGLAYMSWKGTVTTLLVPGPSLA